MDERVALIIDDEMDLCILLTSLLKQMGIKATFATSLTEGKAKLASSPYYLLLLDNNLPDGLGIDSIQELKSIYPNMHILMISAHDGERERIAASDLGAFDFLGKPLTRNKIMNSLKGIYPHITF